MKRQTLIVLFLGTACVVASSFCIDVVGGEESRPLSVLRSLASILRSAHELIASSRRKPTTADQCASSPCRNGATCISSGSGSGSGYSCSCPPRYTGRVCDTSVDLCTSTPCLNGATCVSAPGLVLCFCAVGFSGLHCDISLSTSNSSACDAAPCLNNGICLPSAANTYTCICQPSFVGSNCQQALTTVIASTSSPSGWSSLAAAMTNHWSFDNASLVDTLTQHSLRGSGSWAVEFTKDRDGRPNDAVFLNYNYLTMGPAEKPFVSLNTATDAGGFTIAVWVLAQVNQDPHRTFTTSKTIS